MTTDSKEIALIGPNLTPAVIYGEGGVDRILDEIITRARSEVLDASTAKGRAAIAALAFKVARSKTTLDDMGKDLVADWKKRASTVDAERRRIRDVLDKLKEEVRAPLTKWEEAEEARRAEITARIDAIRSLDTGDRSLAGLRELAARIRAVKIDESFGDQAGAAAIVKDARMTDVEEAIEEARRVEEQMRRIEEKAAAQAAEAAKAEAERARIADEEAAREEAARAEREMVEAAARGEREKIAAAERAEREKAEAEAAEKRRQEDAERRAAAAVEAERRRVAAEEAARKADDDKRAADQEHRRKINKEALVAIQELGAHHELAKAIVLAIINGEVPHVSIRY